MTHHSPIHAALPVPAGSDSATSLRSLSETPPDAPADTPDRWTPERQGAFLRELAACHCVSTAARSVGMSRQSAYRLRARLKGKPFDQAWATAYRGVFDALTEAALDRALNGVEVPHYHQGELVGTYRKYDERLTLALLAMRGAIAQIPDVPSYSIAPRGFDALIERVERGPEDWTDDTHPPRRRR